MESHDRICPKTKRHIKYKKASVEYLSEVKLTEVVIVCLIGMLNSTKVHNFRALGEDRALYGSKSLPC